jgi:serine/threonine-protein kinase HipA
MTGNAGTGRAADVWLWKPGALAPVKAGVFEREGRSGAGRFSYDPGYIQDGGKALDPDQLRQLGARRAIAFPARSREGLPGLFADAGPDSWGRAVLALTLGHVPDPLEALVRGVDDGAGNLVLGNPSEKPVPPPLSLGQLVEALDARIADRPLPLGTLGQILSPDTALGGAKPKATLMIDGFPWIAKLPERGGFANEPWYEALAMRLAARVGIEAAEVRVEPLPGGRAVFLARRFDRERVDGGLARLGFASELTVLGAAGELPGPQRSYLAFARKLARWVDDVDAARHALWRRIAFSGLVANVDDHPRNHALIQRGGTWTLAPAFDIVPTRHAQAHYALAQGFHLTAEGAVGTVVSGRSLMASAPLFGLAADTAHADLLTMGRAIAEQTPDVLEELRAPPTVIDEMQAMRAWAARITREVEGLSPGEFAAPTGRSRRRWSYRP